MCITDPVIRWGGGGGMFSEVPLSVYNPPNTGCYWVGEERCVLLIDVRFKCFSYP